MATGVRSNIQSHTVIDTGGENLTGGHAGRASLVLWHAQFVFIGMRYCAGIRNDQQRNCDQPEISGASAHSEDYNLQARILNTF